MSSTKAPRTLHFDEAATKLSSLTSNLELVKYVPGCNKLSTFLIVATSQLIYYQFGSLLNKLRSNSAFIPRSTRLTHEIASKKLALASSKYELLEFIPGKKSLSLFRDVDGNREVRGNFNVHGSELVAAMQVRRVPTGLDISRYCSLPDMTVQGGFTKLLSHISKIYAPSSIQTFIDLRYGSGIYLEGLGFRKKTCYNSFKWTDYSTTVHRLKHRGNSGYADGLRKIWDCGQAKYIKHMGIYE